MSVYKLRSSIRNKVIVTIIINYNKIVHVPYCDMVTNGLNKWNFITLTNLDVYHNDQPTQ